MSNRFQLRPLFASNIGPPCAARSGDGTHASYLDATEVSLFDGFTCTRGFGRIGSRGGRLMIGLFDTQGEAEAELARWLHAKQERGYQRDLAG